MRVHLLDDWGDALRGLPSFRRLDGHEVTVWTDHAEGSELARRLADAEAVGLFRERTRITDELLDALPRLRLISGRGSSSHVDAAACAARGVTFCSANPPEAVNHAAAELTWALVMAAWRRLPAQLAAAKEGRWQAGAVLGRTLRGRTVGLYGYGRIARQVAGYARAFGMEVVWWGSDAGRARAAADGETVAPSRKAFFAEADILSLHLRLVPETRGIVTKADLALMQPDAVLVNTARAGLIQSGALLRALQAGRPGLAALDVFDAEPVTRMDDPLLSHPRVIATPHVGFVTAEELDRQFSDVADQILAFAAGCPINVVAGPSGASGQQAGHPAARPGSPGQGA